MDALPRVLIALVATGVLSCALTGTVQAQVQAPPAPVTQPPPPPAPPQPPPAINRRRAVRGLFGGGPTPDLNRWRNELAVTASFLGGYDDNASPTGGPAIGTPGIDPRLSQSAYIGTADIGFEYGRAKLTRMFTLGGNAFFNDYRDLDLGISSGGNVRLGMTSPIGRSVTGRANAAFSSVRARAMPSRSASSSSRFVAMSDGSDFEAMRVASSMVSSTRVSGEH